MNAGELDNIRMEDVRPGDCLYDCGGPAKFLLDEGDYLVILDYRERYDPYHEGREKTLVDIDYISTGPNGIVERFSTECS